MADLVSPYKQITRVESFSASSLATLDTNTNAFLAGLDADTSKTYSAIVSGVALVENSASPGTFLYVRSVQYTYVDYTAPTGS